MGIWGLLFSFNGRIPRKTYWLATLIIVAIGMAAVAGAAFYLTGDALSPIIWAQPQEKINVWGPVWGVYVLVILWPALAIAIKRWHDRNRPAWAYLLIYLIFLAPLALKFAGHYPTEADLEAVKSMGNPDFLLTSEQTSKLATAAILGLVIGVLAFYVTIELGFLEGTNGPNRYGQDPLPPRPAKAWAGFGGRMFGLRGRIGRSGWWYGLLMTFIILTLVMAASAGMFYAVFPFQDETMMKNMGDPQWVQSPEGMQQLKAIGAAGVLSTVLLFMPFWNLIAISVKRLHDQGRTGWWILLPMVAFFVALAAPAAIMIALHGTTPNETLVQYIGAVWAAYGLIALWCLIQYGMFGSNAGPNRYGEPRA